MQAIKFGSQLLNRFKPYFQTLLIGSLLESCVTNRLAIHAIYFFPGCLVQLAPPLVFIILVLYEYSVGCVLNAEGQLWKYNTQSGKGRGQAIIARGQVDLRNTLIWTIAIYALRKMNDRSIV